MSKVAVITSTDGTRFDILKESVAAVMKRRDGRAIAFTTCGAITLGTVTESSDQLRELLMGAEDDETL